MSKTLRSRALRTAAALGVSSLLLTGCGAGPVGPGVAIEIGDETISTAHVDRAASHMCEALEQQFRNQSTVVPMANIRQGVVQLLSLRSIASQIAEEYGVVPGEVYERDVAEKRKIVSHHPAEVRESYVEVMTANSLATAVVDEVGRAKLVAEGIAEPTVEQATQAGEDVFTTWPDTHGVTIDPRYGLELRDGRLEPADTNLSVAVSDLAKQGLAIETDPSYAASLPEAQRCG